MYLYLLTLGSDLWCSSLSVLLRIQLEYKARTMHLSSLKARVSLFISLQEKALSDLQCPVLKSWLPNLDSAITALDCWVALLFENP